MEADRDLLLGVLAYQLEMISLEQFVRVYSSWAQQSHRKFDELLMASINLAAEDAEWLDTLRERLISKRNGDVKRTLEERLDPNLRQLLLQNADSRMRLTADLTPESDVVRIGAIHPPATAGSVNASHRDRQSRYSFTRVQGEGGLGRVWLARDQVLQRSVALKEPLSKETMSSTDVLRFVQEAQVTGQLEHPNIVPVYELVHDADKGDVYYTMRFVRGRTLSEAITAYHDRRQNNTATALDLRTLLTAFVTVCHAIAYAHSRGVIHRDLKPGNVMLGSFGEVNILDWGLAKVIGTDDSAPTHSVQVPDEYRLEKSKTGAVLGTIAYMSPEQAAGEIDQIDHRTDIYGLGAMLFAILTNSAPHRATQTDGTKDVLRRIKNSPPPRAKELLESVPAPLDAICGHAMSHAKAARYDSAMDLADDVERFLADEDVSVYRTPSSTRMLRWMRRNRTWAVSSIGALSVITVVSVVAGLWIERARRDESLAKDTAQTALLAETTARMREAEAKEEATRRFRQSQRTVDTMLSGVGEVLEYYPGAKAVRAKLLEEAAKAYADFSQEDAGDPQLRLESARAAVRLGDVRMMLGEHSTALAAFKAAIEIFDRVDDEELRADAATEAALCAAKAGSIRGELEATATAEKDFEAALARLANIAETASTTSARVSIMLNRARMRCRTDARQAKDDLEACEQIITDLQRDISKNKLRGDQASRFVENVALSRSLLGQTLANLGASEAATKILARAVDSYSELTILSQDYPPHLDGFAFSKISLANALRPLGREDEQLQLLKAATNDYLALTNSMPETPRFVENLAVSRTNYAWTLHQRGQNQLAKTTLDEAIGELTKLCRSPVRVPRNLEELAQAAVLLGEVLSELDENDAALTNLQSAIAVYETNLLPQHPGSARYVRGLGAAQRRLADLLVKLSDTTNADELFTDAIERLQAALARDDEPFARDELAFALEHRAELLLQLGKNEVAERLLAEAEKTRDKLPPAPEYRYKAAVLASKSTQATTRERAFTLAKKLAGDFPPNAKYQTLLGALHQQRGDVETAQAVLASVDEAGVALNSPYHFWLALAHASSSQQEHKTKAVRILEQATARHREHAPGKRELLELQQQVQKRLE